MAAPFPANMAICDPKCKCGYGPNAGQAYNCNDPCGTGNKGDLNPVDCSCPDIYYAEPALYINAVMVRCQTVTNYDGWTTYIPSTDAQNYSPISARLTPYDTRACDVGFRVVSSLQVEWTYSDGSKRRSLGGTSFITNHNQSMTLNSWAFGDWTADYIYPLTITENPR